MDAPLGQVVANGFRAAGLFLLKVLLTLWVGLKWLGVHLAVLFVKLFPLLLKLFLLLLKAFIAIGLLLAKLFLRIFFSIFKI